MFPDAGCQNGRRINEGSQPGNFFQSCIEMFVAREVHPRSSDHRGTADPGTAMDENLAASDVVGNRTHDCVELVNWNRLSIINGNVNVGDFAARIARRSLTERNHG